jgi:hypothetical protein
VTRAYLLPRLFITAIWKDHQRHATLDHLGPPQYQQLQRPPPQQHIPSMLQEHSYYTLYPAMQQIRSRTCCKQTFIIVAFTFTTPLIKPQPPLIDFEQPKPRLLFSLSTATASHLTSLLLRCDNAATFLFTQHTSITSQRSNVAPHFASHSHHFLHNILHSEPVSV